MLAALEVRDSREASNTKEFYLKDPQLAICFIKELMITSTHGTATAEAGLKYKWKIRICT